jgi:hypothetical protein
MTLTSAQADYVISTDATYAGSLFGFSLARLGDFTGDGIDDFAISARGFGSNVGRVVIIPGKAVGFGSVALPNTTNAIVIDGNPAIGTSLFGYRILGIGHFYSVTTGTTMIVSAPGTTSSTPANAGHVYAFHGQSGAGGLIPIASADEVIAGPANAARIGIVLSNLSTMLNGFAGVAVGNLLDAIDIPGGHGGLYLGFGTPATGPLASQIIAYLANANAVGGISIGGGIPGRDSRVSLIGDATPDLVVAGEINSPLTISDGAKVLGKASPIELGSTAEVNIPLPGWSSAEAAGSIVTDINGDGVADICIGSQLQPGSVRVYW